MGVRGSKINNFGTGKGERVIYFVSRIVFVFGGDVRRIRILP